MASSRFQNQARLGQSLQFISPQTATLFFGTVRSLPSIKYRPLFRDKPPFRSENEIGICVYD